MVKTDGKRTVAHPHTDVDAAYREAVALAEEVAKTLLYLHRQIADAGGPAPATPMKVLALMGMRDASSTEFTKLLAEQLSFGIRSNSFAGVVMNDPMNYDALAPLDYDSLMDDWLTTEKPPTKADRGQYDAVEGPAPIPYDIDVDQLDALGAWYNGSSNGTGKTFNFDEPDLTLASRKWAMIMDGQTPQDVKSEDCSPGVLVRAVVYVWRRERGWLYDREAVTEDTEVLMKWYNHVNKEQG